MKIYNYIKVIVGMLLQFILFGGVILSGIIACLFGMLYFMLIDPDIAWISIIRDSASINRLWILTLSITISGLTAVCVTVSYLLLRKKSKN